MKIRELKKGFKAICTEENEKETCFSIGDEMGFISKETGKFHGALACIMELKDAYKSYLNTIKKSYKVWVVIEEVSVFPDGSEKYEDLKEETRSAGHFDTVEEAIDTMEKIGETYEGDFRK
jgi:hypothetical protein